MDFRRRKCVKANESMDDLPEAQRLKAFKQYDRTSCLLECRANLMQDECGCLPYYYPNFGSVWGKKTTCDLEGYQHLLSGLLPNYLVKFIPI